MRALGMTVGAAVQVFNIFGLLVWVRPVFFGMLSPSQDAWRLAMKLARWDFMDMSLRLAGPLFLSLIGPTGHS